MKFVGLDEVKISRASLNNSRDILKLLNSSKNLVGYQGEKFTLSEVKDYINAKVNFVIISKIKEKVMGVMISNFWRDYCYLYLFIIEKKYRHMGIGNKMMEYLENKAKIKGYIGLFTKKEDKEMMSLIEKRGYIKGDKFIYFHKNLK